MRRWNGWGDDATSMELNPGARAMLRERLGPGNPGQDADRRQLLRQIPRTRMARHRLIRTDADTRFSMAFGESYGDWIRKRFGHVPPVPDGVAFPKSRDEVHTLLDLAQQP